MYPNPLYRIMEGSGRPVIAVAATEAPDTSRAMSMAQLGPNYRSLSHDEPKGLTLATPALHRIGDKVRERITVYCADNGVREVALPGIAEAVREVLSKQKQTSEQMTKGEPSEAMHNCVKSPEESAPIVFMEPFYLPLGIEQRSPHFTEIPAINVTASLPELYR